MSGCKDNPKPRWIAAGVVALGVALGVLSLFRAPATLAASQGAHGQVGWGSESTKGSSKAVAAKGIMLVSQSDRLVTAESILLDPTPLFLPTKWNAAQNEVEAREAGILAQGYDTPKLTFKENELKLALPAPIETPASVAEAVAQDVRSAVFAGFGRVDSVVATPEPRGAFIEITLAGTGQKVIAQALAVRPPGQGGWQPVEYHAKVDAAGLVGLPLVTARSGNDEVDLFFANYLARTLRIGERLEPGFYRISVGP